MDQSTLSFEARALLEQAGVEVDEARAVAQLAVFEAEQAKKLARALRVLSPETEPGNELAMVVQGRRLSPATVEPQECVFKSISPVNLEVPYAEKDTVNALGAKWDSDAKKWFVPPWMDLAPFSRAPPPASLARAHTDRMVIAARLELGLRGAPHFFLTITVAPFHRARPPASLARARPPSDLTRVCAGAQVGTSGTASTSPPTSRTSR